MTQTASDQPQTAGITDPREARRAKRDAYEAAGKNPYAYNYPKTHDASQLVDHYKDLPDGEETTDEVSIAGRVMAMRNNGMFLDVKDTSGRIQVFCHKDSMSDEMLAELNYLDLGDIVGAKGTMRRTPRGELSVRATEIQLVTKSLEPIPEKHHGLTDIETRYRQRYLDLISNDESARPLLMRSEIIAYLRQYMRDMGAVETETPILQPIMGGASAKPFVTHHNTLGSDFYLKVAAELYLKRLLVGGMTDHVFEIGRYFRNEGVSPKHNPEFTMMEGNVLWWDYKDVMNFVETILSELVKHLNNGKTTTTYGDHELDFAGPWPRETMCGSIEKRTGVNPLDYDRDALADKAKELKCDIAPTMKWGDIVAEMFDEHVEPTLIQPTHITHLPYDISPLAKLDREDPRLTERFESFCNGWEIANAFTEQNDPDIQQASFDLQDAAREAGDEEAQMIDDDYVTALKVGLPPNGGYGIGIDRLTMLLTNSTNIRDVICFPTLKPLKSTPKAVETKDTINTEILSKDEILKLDDNKYRFAVVVNGKEESIGRIMNAVGHSMAGLVGKSDVSDFCFIDYEDKEGEIHPSISHYPTIILKAKNSNQILTARNKAKEKGIAFVDFTETMTAGSSKAQLEETKGVATEDLNYFAVAMFGKTEDLKEVTGKFSLYK
jgi:lysyl-tRNA synthetase class 2